MMSNHFPYEKIHRWDNDTPIEETMGNNTINNVNIF